MYTEIRLKMHCPNRLIKLNWFMFIYTDYSGFIQATHSHLYLILIHLRRAKVKEKYIIGWYKPAGEECYVMLTY